jgi:hypothetical protein
MMVPIHAGTNLPISEWSKLRLRAIFDYCKWDPQCGDDSVLGRFPLLLEFDTAVELGHLAECLTREALAAEDEILSNTRLLRRLSIPKSIRECLEKPENVPRSNHVRVMRFDFHLTTRGWQISEVNADVPGGYLAWAPPDSIWSPCAVPVPFAQIVCGGFEATQEMESVKDLAAGLTPEPDLAVILDLPGDQACG